MKKFRKKTVGRGTRGEKDVKCVCLCWGGQKGVCYDGEDCTEGVGKMKLEEADGICKTLQDMARCLNFIVNKTQNKLLVIVAERKNK